MLTNSISYQARQLLRQQRRIYDNLKLKQTYENEVNYVINFILTALEKYNKDGILIKRFTFILQEPINDTSDAFCMCCQICSGNTNIKEEKIDLFVYSKEVYLDRSLTEPIIDYSFSLDAFNFIKNYMRNPLNGLNDLFTASITTLVNFNKVHKLEICPILNLDN